MSRPRTFSWSAALRDIYSDRIHFAPGERRRILREQGFADLAFRRASHGVNSQSLLSGNSFDRRGIMLLAIEFAQARREVTGEHWRVCLSSALKGTWKAAKAIRAVREAQQKFLAAEAERASVARSVGDTGVTVSRLNTPSEAHTLEPTSILAVPLRLEPRLLVHARRSLPRRSGFSPITR